MAADNNELGNGRVTLALVQRTAEENGKNISDLYDDIKDMKIMLYDALAESARYDERIKGLSTRTFVSDGINLIVALLASIFFGRA